MIEEAGHHHPLSHCAAVVRESEPERYLATLFAPAAAREPLFALYAFDHEIARVRRVVSEPMPGLIRLQWWREALAGIAAGQPVAHPVVAALRAHWAVLGPLRPRLEAALEARELELTSAPPPDLPALEQRLEAGCGAITLAAVELVGASDDDTRAAARHLGVALGLVRLLRLPPGDLQRSLLPGLKPGRLDTDPAGVPAANNQPLSRVVADLAARARHHLHAARRRRGRVPPAARTVLLCAPLLDDYLDRLARAGHHPLALAGARPAAWAPLKLLVYHALARY